MRTVSALRRNRGNHIYAAKCFIKRYIKKRARVRTEKMRQYWMRKLSEAKRYLESNQRDLDAAHGEVSHGPSRTARGQNGRRA